MGSGSWLVSITVTALVISTLAEKLQRDTNEVDDIKIPSDKVLSGRVNRTILDTLENGVVTALEKLGDDAVNVVKEIQAKAVQLGEKVLEIDSKLRTDLDEVERIENKLNDSAKQVDTLKNEVLSLGEKHDASFQTLNNKTAYLSAAKQKLTKIMEDIQKIKGLCSSKCKRSTTDKDRRLSDVKLDKRESNRFLKSPRSRIIRGLVDYGIQRQRQKRGRIREWIENRREEVEEVKEWFREKARERQENDREKRERIRESIVEKAREAEERKREMVVEKLRETAERVKENIQTRKRDVSVSTLCNDNEECKALLEALTTEMKTLQAQIAEFQSEVDDALQVKNAAKSSLDAAMKTLTDLDKSVKLLSKALEEAERTVDETNVKLEEARDDFDEAKKIFAETKERERLGLEIASKMAEAKPDDVIDIKSLSYDVKDAKTNVGEFEGIMVASFFDGPEQSFSFKVTLALIESMVNDLVETVKESITI